MTNHSEAGSRSWRKYLRFSVRGLIIFVLLFGGGLGWWIHAARVQRDVVAAIKKARGVARYNIRFGRNGKLSLSESWSPAWLKNWLGVDYFDTVTVVYLTPNVSHLWLYQGPHDSRDFNPILAQVARLDQLDGCDFLSHPSPTPTSRIFDTFRISNGWICTAQPSLTSGLET